MNSSTYRPRLKKDLWPNFFRFGPKTGTSRQAQSGIRSKIHSWFNIHCVFKILESARFTTKIRALFKAKSVDPKTCSPLYEMYVHCSSRTKLLLCNVRTASLVSLTVLISILLLWYNILISPLTLWWNLSFVVVAAAVVVVIAEQLSCHLPFIYENITILPQYIFTASLSLYFRNSTYGWRSRTKLNGKYITIFTREDEGKAT